MPQTTRLTTNFNTQAAGGDPTYPGLNNAFTGVQEYTEYLTKTIVGTGTPEAAVTAAVGTLFIRTDGPRGRARYVKESGTGNTGWLPLHGKEVNTRTAAADYTLVETDAFKIVDMNTTGAQNVIVPEDTSLGGAGSLGVVFTICQLGAGAITVSPGAITGGGSVALNAINGTLTTPGRYGYLVLRRIGVNTFVVEVSGGGTKALDAHIANASGAHAASAVSYGGSTNLTSTNVEAALDELDAEKASTAALTAHTDAVSSAHSASAIASTPAGNIAATNVQAALNELDTEKAATATLTAHTGATTDAHDASAISVVATGNMNSTNVQAALEEAFTELAAPQLVSLNFQTGTTYTLTTADLGDRIQMSNSGAQTLTIPHSTSFAVGWWCIVSRAGTGALTIAPGTSVTLNSPDSSRTARSQYSDLTLTKIAGTSTTSTWQLSGDLT